MGYSIFTDTMVDLPWTEVEKQIKDGAIVLFPTGVIEAHGPHLDLAVDVYGSYQTCVLTKQALELQGVKVLIAPPFYWGINKMTGAFPGSFTVRKSTMKALIFDILDSLDKWGVTNVFNINHHGDPDHCDTLFDAIKEAHLNLKLNAISVITEREVKGYNLEGEDHILYTVSKASENTSPYFDIHAGAFETSMMYKYFRNQVDTELAKKLLPTNLDYNGLIKWREGYEASRLVTPLAYFGAPADFEKEYTEMQESSNAIASVILNYLNISK